MIFGVWLLDTLLVDLRTEKNNLNGAGATEAPDLVQLRLLAFQRPKKV